MKVIRKDATITPTSAPEDFPGTFEVILSAPTKDRDGDTLLAEEWKLPLPDHITFDSDHGMSVATTVGSGVPRIDDETGNLIVAGTYSSLPRAQEVRTLVNEGHIRTTSVAFMTERDQKAAGKVTRELLNGAFVAVPSNREALVLSSKSAAVKAGARNSAADKETIQAILDAALALGAVVPDGKAVSRPGQKSIVGSVEALRDRVQAALRDANEGKWVWIRGTIPGADGAGVVVFEIEDPDTYETTLLQQGYTDDGNAATLTGTAAAVGVAEIVTPDPGTSEATPSPDGDDETPATGTRSVPAAGDSQSPSGDAAAELQVRAARIRANAALALHNPEGN